ncbi:M48 family metallopeptidase [Zobellia uliginosa]|uniref:M48 family metallopeptidase n=1 Tax=Zobellia uliginosa TaxID=143224 RepID=UPI0026E18798|nr:SprT family zinc-dependent metalloprotease [Zobellia uliginosa]MDO6516580.1 SprT family zinc-dependent metalloprotease [Zobellia uliginosa]
MYQVKYGSTIIDFDIKRTKRKTLAIEVHPDSTVHLVAPENAQLPEIKEKIIKRGRWILKQQYYFEQFLPHTPAREYISGETHYYLGKRYLLKVKRDNNKSVKLKGGQLLVSTPDPSKVKSLLASWYYEHAKRKFKSILNNAIPRFNKKGIRLERLDIKRMKNRWGSCTPNGVITLNPELIKAPSKCIEYVILHELCHLIVPNHKKEFYNLLEQKMPNWKKWKNHLEMELK